MISEAINDDLLISNQVGLFKYMKLPSFTTDKAGSILLNAIDVTLDEVVVDKVGPG